MKISRYFLTPYLIMLLIPVFFEITVFISSSRTLGNNSIDYSLTILEGAAQIVDQRFNELDKIANLLAENVYLRHISFQEDPLDNVYSLYKLQKNLFEYQNVNVVLEDYYIYMRKNNYIVNPYIAYRYDQFYGEIFQHGLFSSTQWRNLIINSPLKNEILASESIRINHNESSYLTYIRRFPSYGDNSGAIIMLVDEEELIKGILNEKNIAGDFYIIDENDSVLASSSTAKILPQGIKIPLQSKNRGSFVYHEKIICHLYSENYGFYYISIQDRETVFKEQTNNRILGVIIISILMMMGIPVAFYFALRNTESRKKIESELENEQKILANLFIGQLRGGEISLKEEDIIDQIEKMKLPLAQGFYRVVIMSLIDSPDEEWPRHKLSLTNVISDKYGDRIFTYEMKAYNRMGLIIRTEDDSKEEITAILELLEKDFQDFLIYPLRWGIGNCYENFSQLDLSLHEARQALQYLILNSHEKQFFFDESLILDNYFFYPNEMESRLIYSVQSGKKESVEEIFNQMHEENFQKRHLHINILNQFTMALWGTILRASNQALIKAAYLEDETHRLNLEMTHYPPGRRFEIIRDFFFQLTLSFKDKQ